MFLISIYDLIPDGYSIICEKYYSVYALLLCMLFILIGIILAGFIERKLFNTTYPNRDFHTRIVTIERKLRKVAEVPTASVSERAVAWEEPATVDTTASTYPTKQYSRLWKSITRPAA